MCMEWINNLFGNGPKLPEIYIPAKPRYPLNIDVNKSLKWKGIVIHHSGDPDDNTGNDFKEIKHYHMSYRIDYDIVTKDEFNRRIQLPDADRHVFEKPWRDVGYNGIIERSESIIIFNYGRSLNMSGAHSAISGNTTFNYTHIGLCIVGNYDVTLPDKDLWNFTLMITRSYMDSFNIEVENVIGHREVYDLLKVKRQKNCPGSKWDMNLFRNDI